MSSTSNGHGSVDVLVVDDAREVRNSIIDLFRLKGIRAVGADDGLEALTLLQAGLRPSLILVDVIMPVLDGVGFRQAQLRDRRLARIPVIFMSGIDSQEMARLLPAMDELAPAGILRKPIAVPELFRLLRKAHWEL